MYVLIDEKTAEGKTLAAQIKKSRAAKILKHPNEKTRQALKDAQAGKGEKIANLKEWFKKVLD